MTPLEELEALQQVAAKGPLVHHAHSVATGAFIEQLRAHFPALATIIRQLAQERDNYKDDFECWDKRLKDALDQCRCPDCKCGDQVEAESSECGCDSPICARPADKTLAEWALSLLDERDAANAAREEMLEAIRWVVRDADYKPPEELTAQYVTERWIERLRVFLKHGAAR